MTIGASVGDLHLGRSLYGFDLTEHTRAIMYRFFRLCVKRGVDYAVQLGDLFDQSRPAPGLEKIVIQWCNEFERAKIDLYLLTGNHDVVSKPGHVSALDAIKAHPYDHVRVVDRPLVKAIDGHTLLMLPFPSVATYLDADGWKQTVSDALRAARQFKRPILAYAHLDASGAVWGTQDMILRGGDFSIPQAVYDCKQVRQIINGHIHNPQRVKRVLIQGAAQRLRIDEAEHDRFFYFHRNGKTLPKGKVTIRDAVNMADFVIDASVDSELELDGIDFDVSDIQGLLAELDQDWTGKIIRLRCWVNERTVIDWAKVEAFLYERGAMFIYPINPQRKPEAAQAEVERIETDPDKAARGFIRQRITEKSERVAIAKEFASLREETGL